MCVCVRARTCMCVNFFIAHYTFAWEYELNRISVSQAEDDNNRFRLDVCIIHI